jgi:hypothetical protein
MKKLFCFIGAFVTVAAIFAAVAVLLKKLKISLSIEGIEDDFEEDDFEDIDVSVDSDEGLFDEDEDTVEEALEELLAGEEADEIEVEIREL